MKVVISGSRNCTDEDLIEEAILLGIKELGITPTVFFHGDAAGVDKISGKICERLGYTVVKYPAKWKDIKGKPSSEIKSNNYGKYWVKAGFHRNQVMVDNADALIAISLGTGGTEDCINRAKKAGLKVYVYSPEEEECFGFDF